MRTNSGVCPRFCRHMRSYLSSGLHRIELNSEYTPRPSPIDASTKRDVFVTRSRSGGPLKNWLVLWLSDAQEDVNFASCDLVFLSSNTQGLEWPASTSSRIKRQGIEYHPVITLAVYWWIVGRSSLDWFARPEPNVILSYPLCSRH